MAKFEVQVVSREIIKPNSSPTNPNYSHHPPHYNLSFLDQIAPSIYNPILLFYSNDYNNQLGPIDDISTRLKTSLSKTLIHYYPLAGRHIRDNLVDCNDEGVPFFETRVNCRISDVVHSRDPAELRKLVPFAVDEIDDVILGVQVNVLECGGVVVGVCLSHRLADGMSVFVFLRTWADVCRGEAKVVLPEFVGAKLFPPKEVPGFDPRTGITTKNIVTRRFVFGSDMIESLRTKYAAAENIDLQKSQRQRVTRVEALSAFIWSRFAYSTKVFSEPNRRCVLVHSVNLRTRSEPPLPEQSFGNLYRIALTPLLPSMDEEGCSDIAFRVRDSISKINNEYIERLQDGDEHLSFINRTSDTILKGQTLSFNFTSFCRFPQYEADFGWGKPVWVGSLYGSFKNLVVFMDTRSGDGVEANITLTEKDMAKFEFDEEMKNYITSPIITTP